MGEATLRAYVAGLALGLVVLGLAGGLALPPLAARGDFGEQWAAARVALEGGDPYDPTTWRGDVARLVSRRSDAAAFVYPPHVTLALVPLALLPVAAAATIWVAASLTLAAIAVGALLRRYPPAHPLVAFGFGFALCGSGAALIAVAQGQWGLALLAAVSWAAVAIARAGWSSGVAAILAAKPQLAPLALLAFARASSGPARRRYAIGAALVLALVAATFVRADWWAEWARGAATFQGARPIRTATIATLVEPLGIAGLALGLAIVVLVLIVSLRARPGAALPRWLAASVVVAPYLQAYDHILLIAPLAIATAERTRRAALLAGTGLAVLIAGDLLVAAATIRSGRDVLGALVPLAVWAIVVLATRRPAPVR